MAGGEGGQDLGDRCLECQDSSALLGRPGRLVARASYADRPPRRHLQKWPRPAALRRPDDCGRPGVAASGGGGPPRRSASGAELGAWGLFCPCSGDAPQGSGEISADARELEGSKRPRSGGVSKAR